MTELTYQTRVERVWYQRIPGNKENMEKFIIKSLTQRALDAGVEIDLDTLVITPLQLTKKGCEDNLQITGVVQIIQDDETKVDIQ